MKQQQANKAIFNGFKRKYYPFFLVCIVVVQFIGVLSFIHQKYSHELVMSIHTSSDEVSQHRHLASNDESSKNFPCQDEKTPDSSGEHVHHCHHAMHPFIATRCSLAIAPIQRVALSNTGAFNLVKDGFYSCLFRPPKI